MNNSVGILGGVGPKATAYFMNMTIEMTEAESDQDHINMVVLNHATIPDRTEYILGKSDRSPENDMIKDAIMLERLGCAFIVIPCNTAHYFFENIKSILKIPVLNIIEETIKEAVEKASKTAILDEITLGVLATEGTVSSGIYSLYANRFGAKCISPEPEYQKKVNEIIYEKVKTGEKVTIEEIDPIISHMRAKGCDAVIMGCTELSVVFKDLKLEDKYLDLVDSLSVLAGKTVLKSGKKIRKTSYR